MTKNKIKTSPWVSRQLDSWAKLNLCERVRPGLSENLARAHPVYKLWTTNQKCNQLHELGLANYRATQSITPTATGWPTASQRTLLLPVCHAPCHVVWSDWSPARVSISFAFSFSSVIRLFDPAHRCPVIDAASATVPRAPSTTGVITTDQP
jgi:hypothetical protein